MRQEVVMATRAAAAAWVLLASWATGCGAFGGKQRKEDSTTSRPQVAVAQLDPPASHPPERDDASAPVVRVALGGSQASPIAVPYLYGYPMYAEGPALQGVQLLRQDNWLDYAKETLTQPDGVVRVVERFPALGCTFEGIQEDEGLYVPLTLTCELPAPKERGASKRPVVGAVAASAKPDAVLEEPSLRKAFYGEWHAQGQGFDGGEGPAYFDTPNGLLGFGFKKGKLSQVGFVFDPAEKRWRKPELWREPSAYVVGQ
jgi:hypothetical protein